MEVSPLDHNIAYPDLTAHGKLDIREMRRIFLILVRAEGETHRFIDWGEPNCKRGPGDKTGASYAFDLYDFAMGTYYYHHV